MADKNTLRDVMRRYIDSEMLPEPIRQIGELIASDTLSRASFDELMQIEEQSVASTLKESLLDLVLTLMRKCVEDHNLSDVEIAELDCLLTIFHIEEGGFYDLRRDAVREIISAQVKWILQDSYVTEQEEVLQRDLQRLFGLSYDQYVALLRPLAEAHIEELERKKQAIQDIKELKLMDDAIRNLRGIFLVGNYQKSVHVTIR